MPGTGRMDQRKMEGMMRQMGIKTKNIDAEEVIIKTGSGELIISNPQVTEITMQGVKTYQIMGDISEKTTINQEDIHIIMEKTGCKEEQAESALKKNNGDIAAAILELSQ